MLCPVCANEVDAQSAFCNKCGAAMAPGGAAAAGTPPPFTQTPYTTQATQYAAAPPVVGGSGLSDSAASAIAYLTIIPAIIFLVIEPYNRVPLVRFHSWQSITLGIAAVVIHIILTMVGVMLHFIPFIGLLLFPVHMLISLAIFVAWLIAILKASKGEWYKLPVIGDFALKQAQR